MKKLKTPVCDMLNLSTPIFQAPLGGATTPQLASAVANYGGLGMLPLGKWPIEKCEELIDDTLDLTD